MSADKDRAVRRVKQKRAKDKKKAAKNAVPVRQAGEPSKKAA